MAKGQGRTRQLSAEERKAVLGTLKQRFDAYPGRHEGVCWPEVEVRLLADPEKLWSVQQMQETGGEPDVVAVDQKTGAVAFYDCAAETPTGRRSVCYDGAALASRKLNKPATSAIEMANAMGITILTEIEYRELQKLGTFDAKTSSWVDTPPAIRTLGGALFCDSRYGVVFVYHNGAESYYAARGFRGGLWV